MTVSEGEIDLVEAAARELACYQPGYNNAILGTVLKRHFPDPSACTTETEKSVLRRCEQIRETRSSEVQD